MGVAVALPFIPLSRDGPYSSWAIHPGEQQAKQFAQFAQFAEHFAALLDTLHVPAELS
jgi:hypothetical protein